jgi:hypothetical protein
MTMNGLEPPLLELAFYLPDRDDFEGLSALVAGVGAQGGAFAGRGWAHFGPDARDRSFGAITDTDLNAVAITNRADVEAFHGDPSARLIQVEMLGASGLPNAGLESVGLLSISPEAVAYGDRHPVAVTTGASIKEDAYRSGVLSRFRNLVRQLEPAYASIVVEWGLESPTDLDKDARSPAFQDFYLSTAHLGSDVTKAARAIFGSERTEALSDGLLVLSSTGWAERPLEPTSVRLARAHEIARLITKAIRAGR